MLMQRDEASRVFRSLPACARRIRVLLLSRADCIFISNRPIRLSSQGGLVCRYFFLSDFFFARLSEQLCLREREFACILVTLRGQTKSRVPNIDLAAMFTESWPQRIFSTLAFDIKSSTGHVKDMI